MNAHKREESLTLEILKAIDEQSDVTQRHLASTLGVALGLANSYLKRCARKGLIKIEQAPANRYLYYLTPRGFAEKSRLTAEYLSYSFDFYRRASMSCTDVLRQCQKQHYQNILLCGISELAEIASLRAKEQNITIIGILDKNSTKKTYIGLPVYTSLEGRTGFDACVITEIDTPSDLLEYVGQWLTKDKIFIPGILDITPA